MTIGVYYLWDGAEVLYVGASRNVEARIRKHLSGDLDFAGYFCDPCKAEELDRNEAKAIAYFRPRFNERYNTLNERDLSITSDIGVHIKSDGQGGRGVPCARARDPLRTDTSSKILE